MTMMKYKWAAGALWKPIGGGMYERAFPWSLIYRIRYRSLIRAVREGAAK